MKDAVVRRAFAALLMTSLVAPAVPAHADQRRIRCESRRDRYEFCEADTDRRVELVQALSSPRKCVQGYSWGYSERGVWVDRGCRAEFLVGREGMGTGAKVAIGSAVGAAILGAVIASNRAQNRSERPPDWLVGSFRGHNYRFEGAELEVTIEPNGHANGYADGAAITGQYEGKSRLTLEGREYEVRRERQDGIYLEEVKDRANHLFLWRVS